MNKVAYHAKEAGTLVGGLVGVILWFVVMAALIGGMLVLTSRLLALILE